MCPSQVSRQQLHHCDGFPSHEHRDSIVPLILKHSHTSQPQPHAAARSQWPLCLHSNPRACPNHRLSSPSPRPTHAQASASVLELLALMSPVDQLQLALFLHRLSRSAKVRLGGGGRWALVKARTG